MISVAGQPRSIEEIQFYLDLHPCPACGERDFSGMSFSTADVEDETFGFYEGPCARCRTERRYRFGEPRSLARTPELELGGPEPSEILSPEALREAAEAYLAQVLDDPAGLGPEALRQARRSVRRATIALRELAKFPSPAGRAGAERGEHAQRLYDRYWQHVAVPPPRPDPAPTSRSQAEALALSPTTVLREGFAGTASGFGDADLVCMQQLRAALVPREAVELLITAWSSALDGAPAGLLSAERLGRVRRTIATQVSWMPGMQQWTHALGDPIRLAEDLDRAIRFLLSVHRLWNLTDAIQTRAPRTG